MTVMSESNTTAQSSHEQFGDKNVNSATAERSHSESRRDSKSSGSIHSSGDSEDIDEIDEQDRLERCSTKHSAMGDASITPIDSVVEIPDEFYDRLPKHRKSQYLSKPHRTESQHDFFSGAKRLIQGRSYHLVSRVL